MMVAIPLALLIQRNHKQVGASELTRSWPEPSLPTTASQRGPVIVLSTEVSSRNPHILRQTRKNLLCQEVDDVAVAAPSDTVGIC